jgi:hypothetical protein
LFLWGNLLSEQSKMRNDPASSHALLVLACRKYQQSYATNASSFQLLYNWGNVLLYRYPPPRPAAAWSCQRLSLMPAGLCQ